MVQRQRSGRMNSIMGIAVSGSLAEQEHNETQRSEESTGDA